MSKSKAKAPKKAAPKSGLVVKNTPAGTHSKFGPAGSNKNISSSKKGGSANSMPRKTT